MSTVLDVLKIKDGTGSWISIPGLKGEPGNGITSLTFNADGTIAVVMDDGTQKTYSGLKTALDTVDDLVIISDTEPTSPTNKIWIDSDSESVQVPTMKDLNDAVYSTHPEVSFQNQTSVSFPDGADDIPLAKLHLTFEPTQEGSGDPSPSNIRPISGCSGVNILKEGKNLFNKENYKYISGYIDGNNIVPNNSNQIVYIPCKPNTTYTASRLRVTGNERFTLTYADNEPVLNGTVSGAGVSAPSAGNVGDKMSLTITTNSTAKYLVLWAWFTSSPSPETLQIEEGADATDYVPFDSQTYSVDWADVAGDIHYADLDVLTGELTVYTEYVELDGTENWDNWGEHRFYINGFHFKNPNTVTELRNETVICSIYLKNRGLEKNSASISYSDNKSVYCCGQRLVLRDDDIADIAAWKAFLADLANNGTPVQVVGELATPAVYQLSPVEVKTILGYNNISCDAGTMEKITYRADFAKYIQKLINNG